MASTELVQHRRDVAGEAIAERVIGQHPLDATDYVIGEELGGPLQERRAGAALLVCQDLGRVCCTTRCSAQGRCLIWTS